MTTYHIIRITRSTGRRVPIGRVYHSLADARVRCAIERQSGDHERFAYITSTTRPFAT